MDNQSHYEQIVDLMIDAWVKGGYAEWSSIDKGFVKQLARRSIVTLQPSQTYAYYAAVAQIDRHALVSHGLYYLPAEMSVMLEPRHVIIARLIDYAGIESPHIICWAF